MQKKKGISLIVLVITIIVMIILAAAVVISLTNTEIINRASDAVSLIEQKEFENSCTLELQILGWKPGEGIDKYKEQLEKELGVTVTSSGDKHVIKKEHLTMTIFNSGQVSEGEVKSWDGITCDTSWYDDSKSEFVLTSPEQLAGLSQLIVDGWSFYGKTVKLGADIDLNNQQWRPIGSQVYYYGDFDGQNHTIYNLKSDNQSYVGLFGLLASSKITNVNIHNVSITNSYYAGAIAGYATGTVIVENVKLTGKVDINGYYYIGGIIGYIQETPTIKNILLDGNINISTTYAGGGILGYAQGKTLIDGIEVKGILKAVGPQYMGGVSGYIVGQPTIKNVKILVEEESFINGTTIDGINNSGGIVGNCTGTFIEPNINFAIIENCDVNINVIIARAGAGGIAGFVDAAKIINCEYTGTVILDSIYDFQEYLSIGGIAGYACNSNDVNNVTIEKCKFNGELKYIFEGQEKEDVDYLNSGIAGGDRSYSSQNLTIIDSYVNDVKVTK